METGELHESGLIFIFVVAEKRERYAALMKNPKKRQSILNRFNHFFDFVPELARQLPRNSPLGKMLRSAGSPESVYVIGGSDDGSDLALNDAIQRCMDSPSGAVISCIPGELALFLQEFPPGDVFLFTTKKRSPSAPATHRV
jgi:hypothetical protein